MPYRTIPGTSVKYALIAFDKDGRERMDDPEGVGGRFSERIRHDVLTSPPTNVFFFSHGWKGDVSAATDQYDRWIGALERLTIDKAKMGSGFRPLWIGLHWPSQPWGDEELSGGSFATVGADLEPLLEQYVAEFGGTPEVRACLEVIFKEQEDNAAALMLPAHVAEAYCTLAELIGYTSTDLAGAPDEDGAAFDPDEAFHTFAEGQDFGGGFFGKFLGPLRQLSFWTMKRRARSIGEAGMHDFFVTLQDALPAARFHLMGHSFGCIVVSSILGGRNGTQPLPRAVNSLVLVQGALSVWGYADTVPDLNRAGYFNAMLKRGAVSGPVLVTRSMHDRAVGVAYPLAVGLVQQAPDFAIDLVPVDIPKYGGIGTFGMRGVEKMVDWELRNAHGEYAFEKGMVYNLEASAFIAKMEGASGAHSDIDGPEVAHAIWQAALAG